MSGISGAVIIRKQNQYMDKFYRAGAVDGIHSINPKDIGIRNNLIFKRMVRREIFIDAGGGRYYMDIQRAREFKNLRRRRAMIALIIVVIFLVICYLLAGR